MKEMFREHELKSELNRDREHACPQVWAVGSGKGGVGKSFFVANMGLAIALRGKKVVLVDLDLGASNLHSYLGINRPKGSLSDFLLGRNDDLNTLVEMVPGSTVGLISGASDHLEVANLKYFQKLKLIRHIKRLNADYVLLDLGAGTSFNTLDFFNIADHGIISVMPEPTSIENAHRFLKSAMYRKLRSVPAETKQIIKQMITDTGSQSLQTLARLVSAVREENPQHAGHIRHVIAGSGLHLIVNQVREPADFQLGYAMALVWKRYYGRKPDSLNYLNYDENVGKNLRNQMIYLNTLPHSRISIQIKHLADTLLNTDSN